MCANCKPVGLKLDGDKLITVYTPAPAAEMYGDIGMMTGGHSPDSFNDWWSDQEYSRTKADQ